MTIYMTTTKDKYELPTAVAESSSELARILGTTKNVVASSISKGRKGWLMVEIQEDEADG